MMDAELQAVFDAAWEVVNYNGPPGGGKHHALRMILRCTLQAHADAHPPELPKAADVPLHAVQCPECGSTCVDVRTELSTGAAKAWCLCCGWSRTTAPPNEAMTSGAPPPELSQAEAECLAQIKAGGKPMAEPVAPSAQPTILQPEKDDVCVLTYPQKLSDMRKTAIRKQWEERVPGVRIIIEEDGPIIRWLRPAKGDDGI